MNQEHEITIADIEMAADRIRSQIIRTPLIPNDYISKEMNADVYFKAESLQHEGSFKIRGATNAVMSLTDEQSATGVIAHSSGNHAAALARASSRRNLNATLVMPHNSSPRKIQSVRKYGIEPVFCEPSSEERQATTDQLIQRTRAHLIHAYDDPNVIAGQGTVGLEMIEQLNHLDAILVPVGGGGLLSGVLLAVKTLKPGIHVWGCEPALADDAKRSLDAGSIRMPERYDTVADGLRTALGEITFPIIKNLVDGILLVTETEILEATRKLVTDAKLVAEPSGAVTLAALSRYREQFRNQSVAVVISGGNMDLGNCRLGNH